VIRLPVVFLCVGALVAASVSSLAADRILEDRLGPTQATLYVANADGTGEKALSQPGSFDYDPSWSPTGDWIVFTSERTGPAELFRMHPDGGALEQLTDAPAYNDQAAFSADGKQVVFVSTRAGGHANLWVLDVATRKARPLTSGEDGGDFRPSWSPDGKWIAFSSDRGSDLPPAKGRWERLQIADVYLVHPDGSGLRRLSQHGGFCGSPKWTADSKSVVAYCMPAQDTWTHRFGDEEGNDRLMKMDIATGAATEIESGPGVKLMPSVLPSGETAYLRRDKTASGVFYGNGTPGPKGDDVRTPSWSPDGKLVVYSRFVFKRPSLLMKEWSRNKDFELFGTAWLPDYDPSGKHLAVTKVVAEDPPGVYTTSLFIGDDGKEPQSVLTRKELMLAPSWSPDGKQIVIGAGDFSSFLDSDVGDKKPVDPANGGAQVAIVNADGLGFQLITSGPNNNAFASFAPDGKHIVYRTQGPDGSGLRIMNLEDRSVKILTDDYDNFPTWSPRSDLIAFMRRIDGFFQICIIHPDGTGFRQLTNVKGNEAHMAWSPDGERLVFTSSRMGFKDEVLYTNNPQPYGEIFVMRYDGTEVEQLTDDQWEEGAPAWQPKPAAAEAASE
jgi:Tol biopolymer transport system component